MAECLISPVLEIGKFICPFLKPHIDYWWFFDDNIQDLRNRIAEMMQRRSYIEEQRRLVLHTDNLLRLDDWLKASTDKLAEAHKILLPIANIPHAINLFSRYSLGKNAKKTAEEVAKLINEGEFNNTADPAPQPAMAYPFHGPIVDLESRKSIEKLIIDFLKKSSVDMIGICGMGGVGKTTMARRIEKRVKEEKLFDEVVWVTVSQTMNLPKIQNEIADSLKLKFDESNRANQLHRRLMDEKTKIIIFDDVWESLNFEELGFPIECNFQRCKVLLTSRSSDTCKTIKNKVVFYLKNLGEEDAWDLFKDKAGKCVEDRNLQPVARDVVKECNGLPLALVTLGVALQGETNIGRWKNSLSALIQGIPSDLTEVLINVYKPLKLSYDCLEKEGKRNLFLMCCLFPEDYDIPIEQLTWYRMFGDNTFIQEPNNTNIEDARNQTNAWVEELKSRSLLIAGEDKFHVKMHDLVRDVAIYIGSKKSDGFLKSLHRSSKENLSDVNCNWMSVDISNGEMKVPVLSRFPKLRLLMLRSNLSSNEFSDISFKGIKDLNVLSFESISIRSLPSTLANLQTLRLFRCQVENIRYIGKLTMLKILSCFGCDNIMELPKEIGSLKDLRLLELSSCWRLQTIPSGVISSLSLLEELKILSSFSEWETRGNASLTELDRLGKLTCLEIKTSNCTLYLSQELVRYTILIYHGLIYFKISGHEKVVNLKLLGGVGNWIQQLERKAEYLSLRGDGSDNINLNHNVLCNNLEFISIRGCSNLRHLFPVSVARTILLQLEVLHIEECESMEQVFCDEIKNNNTDGCIEFPKLKELTLDSLPKLTAFCHGLNIKDDSFSNLKSIKIIKCYKFRSLFSARSCLLQLEVLEIEQCEAMEQVFWNKGTDDCIEFPKLKDLSLRHMQNLTAFCQGLQNIKFPNLTRMYIHDLPKLNSLFPLNSKDVSFSNLEFIDILKCDNLRYLFSVSADDNTNGCIEFPKLKQLTLKNLPNLTAFCQGLQNIKFPNLTRMEIRNLPKLNSLFPPNSETLENTCFYLFCNPKDVSFCNLKYINISRCANLRYLFSVSVARRCLLQLEVLKIVVCDSMEQVFWNEGTDDNTDGCIEFPKLKKLRLWNLPNLTAFCQRLENIIIKFPNLTGMWISKLPKLNSLFNSETVVSHEENTCFLFACNPKDVSFCNLKSILINGCDNLRYLFSVSVARRCLLQLEVLEIYVCQSMEQVIWNEEQVIWNEGTDDNTYGCIEFPKLKKLTLYNLPNLTAFYQGPENIIIKFPNLTGMWICKLRKLNSLFNSETVVSHDENTCFLFACNPKDLLGLESLRIEQCESMEQLFWNDIKDNDTDGCIEFPKLEELILYDLPNLTAFCKLENIIVKFPIHTHISIEGLPKLNESTWGGRGRR